MRGQKNQKPAFYLDPYPLAPGPPLNFADAWRYT